MDAVPTMNEVSGIYELSEEQLDEVNGGRGKWTWRGAATAVSYGAPFGLFGMAFALGVYDGSRG